MQKVYQDVGRVFIPERSISIPGRPARRKPSNIVVATLRRPRWNIEGAFKLPHFEHATPKTRRTIRELIEDYASKLDPALFMGELIWASISHNDRVQDGGDHNVNRIFGTVGASNAAATFLAISNLAVVAVVSHASIMSDTQGLTTNEFTTIGLTRVAGTVQNYTAPATLDAVFDVDLYKSYSITGSGTAKGAAIFDQLVAAGSWMLCEDPFTSDAVVENGDTLNVTYTYQN